MLERIHLFANKALQYCYYLLFLLVPLILTPWNFELFEYNKMMVTYSIAIVVAFSWIIKMILEKRLIIKKTPLDIPLMLFLLSQIVSTLFSLDRHVSIFGYYSRFNGGLLSVLAYILLYYAFVSNFPSEKVGRFWKTALFSGFLVSVYGILEHFGIDKNLWVQDVQNRVFSTLGQPNWLAAYLAVLIPISLSMGLNNVLNRHTAHGAKYHISLPAQTGNIKNQKEKVTSKEIKSPLVLFLSKYLILSIIFFITLIFTKSRSGFLGLWTALIFFWLVLMFQYKKRILKLLLMINFAFFLVMFTFGVPIQRLNKLTWVELAKLESKSSQSVQKPTGSSIIDIGITESGVIRNIVWQGAVDIFRHYPLIGSGVETFAFSYYKFRPSQHNMTSEWDFLYNKAHNEYLNYAATTGIFGLGSHLLIIGVFIFWFINNILAKPTTSDPAWQAGRQRLANGLFSSWLSILITNFFGFSVVIVQLLFYLIPASIIVLIQKKQLSPSTTQGVDHQTIKQAKFSSSQNILIIVSILIFAYLQYMLVRLWLADFYFARGYNYSKAQQYTQGYENIRKAVIINQNEPFYYDELAYPASAISLAFFSEGQTTASAEFANQAISASDRAIKISPNNVNFFKTRTRVLYGLTTISDRYLTPAIESLEKAHLLSPTDPKILYNLALLYDQVDDREKTIALLEETTKLKPDYRDAYYALGIYYTQNGEKEKAKQALNFILTRLNPDDSDAKKQLEEIK